jgi:hypothetical protein
MAGDQFGDLQLAPGHLGIEIRRGISPGHRGRAHGERRHRAQRSRDFVGEPEPQEVRLQIGAQVLEWQYCDRRLRRPAGPGVPRTAGEPRARRNQQDDDDAGHAQPPIPCSPGRRLSHARRNRRGGGGSPRVDVALQSLEVGSEIRRGLIPHPAVLFECLGNDSVQLGGQLGIHCRQTNGDAIQDSVENDPDVWPEYAGRPVAISCSTSPYENRSVRGSSCSPRICSGDM